MTLIDDHCDGCGSRFDPMGDPHLTKHPEIGPYAVFCARCEHDTTTPTPANQGGSAMTDPKYSPWRAMSNSALILALILIQTLAALSLDGWLAIAMWVIVARNGAILALAAFGIASKAAEALNAEDHR